MLGGRVGVGRSRVRWKVVDEEVRCNGRITTEVEVMGEDAFGLWEKEARDGMSDDENVQ
jgi:hypothetical protein